MAVAAGSASGPTDWSTDREPVIIPDESSNAISMNEAAAPMVIFDRTLAVPRGPNAVLDTLLENSAPAFDLPGCSRMTTTSTRQDKMNKPYRI